MKEEEHEWEERPSKSQLKREAHAAQKLGENLVALSDKQLKNLNLPEKLFDAVVFAQSIKSNSARARQMQYIGRLMREIDIDPIEKSMERIVLAKRQSAAKFHEVEQWRDALIDDDATGRFIELYSDVDIQQLRQLVRNAQKEKKQGKSNKAYRALFRFISPIVLPETN